MKKTLLLCFIHGFKGDDNTFKQFPTVLCNLVARSLPKIHVESIIYPAYATRGDLNACVASFKKWLRATVNDREVENGAPSPIVHPSVMVVLCGHSMGGIVAADTLLSIASEQSIPSESSDSGDSGSQSSSTLRAPYIQGILTFDTPFLGISPGVVAHGAEGHWNTATAALSTCRSVANTFGWRKNQSTNANVLAASKTQLPASPPLSSPAASVVDPNVDTAVVPAWQHFGRVAMFAGVAGALAAAAGSAAYMNREHLSNGWQFVGSHLEFVGCLARQEDLKARMAKVAELSQNQGVGFANLYTRLGLAVQKQGSPVTKLSSGVLGVQRTFCTVPTADFEKYFIEIVNDHSTTETSAHMNMFNPKGHPNYYTMINTAKCRIVQWASTSWYDEADGYDPSPRPAVAADKLPPVDDDLEVIEPPDVDQNDYEDLAEMIKRRRT